MQPTLRTARLTLTACSAKDVEQLRALWNEPQVREFIFDDEPVSLQRTQELVKGMLDLAPRGLGLWLMRETNGETLAGCVALLQPDSLAAIEPQLPAGSELMIALHPNSWNRGMATEACRELIGYAFDDLRLERLIAGVDTPNIASAKLITALGFQPFSHRQGPKYPLQIYTLDNTK